LLVSQVPAPVIMACRGYRTLRWNRFSEVNMNDVESAVLQSAPVWCYGYTTGARMNVQRFEVVSLLSRDEM
jgi:hypothetical protein